MKTRKQVLENLFLGNMLFNKQVNKYYRWHNETLEVSQKTPNGPWKNSQLVVNMNTENFEVFTPPPRVTAFAYKRGLELLGDIDFVLENSERYQQLKSSRDHVEVEISPEMVLMRAIL